MEPTDASIQMMGQNDMSLLSQSFIPNFIKNAEDEDQSHDITG
jgi:hypothetical protein